MSEIKVLTPSGQWSETVCGLDKIHLMESAIQSEYINTPYWSERMDAGIDEDYFGPSYTLQDIEVDTKEITTSFMNKCPLIENNLIKWRFFKGFSGVDLTKAKSFRMRLSTLQSMANKETLLSEIYKKFISAAKVPSPAPDDYCLMFKFEDEI